MLFEDPIRTISVELPAGWTYNLFESTLTDFYFARWDRPSEIIGVHVRPASAAQDEPDENWIRQIQAHVGEKVVLKPIGCPTGCAVAAEFGSENGPAQHVSFIRGPKVELVLEQRSPEAQRNRWTPLDLAVQTVISPVNLGTFNDPGVDEFNQCMENANQSFAKQDFSAVINALQKAIDIGTFSWLYSLAPPVKSPDLNAAVRVAQAMMHASGLMQDPVMQRSSESVLRRALCTLERMPVSSEETQNIKKELNQALDIMASELLEGTEEKASGDLSPVVAMRERGFRAAKAAEDAFIALDFESAYNMAGLAEDDLLALLSILRRPQAQPEEIPGEIALHLAEQGISDSAAQREVMRKARESLLFPPLVSALQLRFSCALQLGNFGFTESADLLLSITHILYEDNPEDPGIALNQALACAFFSGACALQPDDESAKSAERYLGRACKVIESVADARETGWVRHHERHFEGLLHSLQRRLALLEEREEDGDTKRIADICSRFEKLAAEFKQKA